MGRKKREIETTNARPFVKWAGGKGQLLKTLELFLPADFKEQQNITYIEPFVGGGAMLFYLMKKYKNITKVIINDVNKDLIQCYEIIKEHPQTMIEKLKRYKDEFSQWDSIEDKTQYYNSIRNQYNQNELTGEDRACLFMFLNHTCFNGLYRVNSDGGFNVPYGQYKKPRIINEDMVWADHAILQNVQIMCGDYKQIINNIKNEYTFAYFDPPYRPLNPNGFNKYNKNRFGDEEQRVLKEFCDELTKKGCKILVSNSNSKEKDGSSFFRNLYKGYYINSVLAHRFINAHLVDSTREKTKELVIRNYQNCLQSLEEDSRNNKEENTTITDN